MTEPEEYADNEMRCAHCWNVTEHLGTRGGRIAVYLDERDAFDLASLYGSGDRFVHDLLAAIERAYPKPDEDTRWAVTLPTCPACTHIGHLFAPYGKCRTAGCLCRTDMVDRCASCGHEQFDHRDGGCSGVLPYSHSACGCPRHTGTEDLQ